MVYNHDYCKTFCKNFRKKKKDKFCKEFTYSVIQIPGIRYSTSNLYVRPLKARYIIH